MNKVNIIFFGGLIVLFSSSLFLSGGLDNPNPQSGAMVGEMAPALALPIIVQKKTAVQKKNAPLKIVNFFATWCEYCRAENKIMENISEISEVSLHAVLVHDTKESLRLWLAENKNPYETIAFDPEGVTLSSWKVIGTPQLYIVDPRDVIIYQYSGVVTQEIFIKEIIPIIKKYIK